MSAQPEDSSVLDLLSRAIDGECEDTELALMGVRARVAQLIQHNRIYRDALEKISNHQGATRQPVSNSVKKSAMARAALNQVLGGGPC